MRLAGTIFLLGALVLCMSYPSDVFAQAPADIPAGDNSINYTQVGLAGLTFLLAGLWYSCAGFIKKFRRSLTDETVKIDPRRMGKSIIVGLITGVAAFIVTFISGDVMTVSTPEEFGVLFGIATGIVMTVDKTILGGAGRPAPKPTAKLLTAPKTDVEIIAQPSQAPGTPQVPEPLPEVIGDSLPPLDIETPPGKEGTQ